MPTVYRGVHVAHLLRKFETTVMTSHERLVSRERSGAMLHHYDVNSPITPLMRARDWLMTAAACHCTNTSQGPLYPLCRKQFNKWWLTLYIECWFCLVQLTGVLR
jgi:hypothetical protein